MARICSNCQQETVTEEKQTFTYRDCYGSKWDAIVRPVCDACIEAGYYQDEDNKSRLHLGSSRYHEYLHNPLHKEVPNN